MRQEANHLLQSIAERDQRLSAFRKKPTVKYDLPTKEYTSYWSHLGAGSNGMYSEVGKSMGSSLSALNDQVVSLQTKKKKMSEEMFSLIVDNNKLEQGVMKLRKELLERDQELQSLLTKALSLSSDPFIRSIFQAELDKTKESTGNSDMPPPPPKKKTGKTVKFKDKA